MSAPAGNIIYDLTGLYRFAAVPIAGLIIFILINIFGMIPKFLYKRAMRTIIEFEDGKKHSFYKPNKISRFCGLIVMLPLALFMVSFVYWTASAVQQKESGLFQNIMAYPAKMAIGSGLQLSLGNNKDSEYSPLKLAELIKNPSRAVSKINDLVNDPTLNNLIKDQSLISAIRDADAAQIETNQSLTRLLKNASAMNKLHEVGLVPDNYKTPEYKQQLANRLSEVGARMKEIENDPDVQDIINELKGQGKLSQTQIRSLITDKRFLKIVDRIVYETK